MVTSLCFCFVVPILKYVNNTWKAHPMGCDHKKQLHLFGPGWNSQILLITLRFFFFLSFNIIYAWNSVSIIKILFLCNNQNYELYLYFRLLLPTAGSDLLHQGKPDIREVRNQERELDSLLFPFIAFLLPLLQFYNSPRLCAEREGEPAGQENSYLINADAGFSRLLLDLADV